jgi:hypothetical protein
MNVISWEQGEDPITDFPKGVYHQLARVIQCVNDICCTGSGHAAPAGYSQSGDLICPECSGRVLNLAHRAVGSQVAVDAYTRKMGGKVRDNVRAVEMTFAIWLSQSFDPKNCKDVIGEGERVMTRLESRLDWTAKATPTVVTEVSLKRMAVAKPVPDWVAMESWYQSAVTDWLDHAAQSPLAVAGSTGPGI